MIDTFKNQMPNKKPRPTRLDSSVYAFVFFFLFCFVFFFSVVVSKLLQTIELREHN